MIYLLALILFFFSTPANAKTVWVRGAGGTATTSCTTASGNTDPGSYFRTMMALWTNCTGGNAIVAGDTISIYGTNGGTQLTYNESVVNNSESYAGNIPAGGTGFPSLPVGVSGWGVIGSPITIQGVNGVPRFTGGANGACVQFNEGPITVHYYIFRGMFFDNCGTGGNGNPTDQHHIKYENMEMANQAAGMGMDYYGGNLWVTGSKVHDITTTHPSTCNGLTPCPYYNQWHAIYLEGPNAVIENNELYNVPFGFGIHQYTGSSSVITDNAIVRNNYIHHIGRADNTVNGVSCFTINNGTNARYYNNVCANSMQGGGGTGSNWQIVNNTFYNIGFPGCNCTAVIDLYGSDGALLENNIVYATTSAIPTLFNTASATNFTINNNPTTQPNFANSNPTLFADFKLTAASLNMIDKGIDLTTISGFNYDASIPPVTRPPGRWDIGAYEYLQGGGGAVTITIVAASPIINCDTTPNPNSCNVPNSTVTLTGTSSLP